MTSMKPRILTRVSAIVTTYNEEKHIAACLDQLDWCDEVLVVDSFSTDRTVEIVRGYKNARLMQRPYFGGASQKNWAIDHITHDWVLIFDADERCTPALREEIQTLLDGEPEHSAYTIHRKVFFLGKHIRFSGWQNDRVVRLFRRGTARYANRRVHARLLTRGHAPRLRESMIHYMSDNFHQYSRRIHKYAYWGAAQMWLDGKRSNFFHIVPRSMWRFLRTYGLQLGILDGMHGLVFCMLQAYGTFLKLAILWGWQINAARGIEPDLPEFDLDPMVWRDPVRMDPVRMDPVRMDPVRPDPVKIEPMRSGPAAIDHPVVGETRDGEVGAASLIQGRRN